MVGKGKRITGIISELYVIILLCIFPLYFYNNHYIRIIYQKTIFLYVSTAIIALCFFAVLFIFRQKLKELLPLTIVDYAALAYLYWTIVSAALSPYRGHLWMGVPERHDGIISQAVYVFIYFIISRYYKIKKRDFYLFAVSATILSFIGILQFYNILFVDWFPFDHIDHSNRQPFLLLDSYTMHFRTTLGNVNFVSSYASVAAIFCYVLYIFDNKIGRYWYLAVAVLCTYLLFICNTESGIVAIAMSFMLIFFLVFYKREALSRVCMSVAVVLIVYMLYAASYRIRVARTMNSETLYIILAVVVLFIGAGILLHFNPFKIKKLNLTRKQRMIVIVSLFVLLIAGGLLGIEFFGRNPSTGMVYEMREILSGRIRLDFGNHRIRIWNESLRVWHRRPIFGTGPDTFYYATEENLRQWSLEHEVIMDKAHNEYLQILVCLGIPGLLAYVTLIGGAAVSGLKGFFVKNESNPYQMGAVCAVFTYAVQAFFNINMPITAPLLWVFIAMSGKYTEDVI